MFVGEEVAVFEAQVGGIETKSGKSEDKLADAKSEVEDVHERVSFTPATENASTEDAHLDVVV